MEEEKRRYPLLKLKQNGTYALYTEPDIRVILGTKKAFDDIVKDKELNIEFEKSINEQLIELINHK